MEIRSCAPRTTKRPLANGFHWNSLPYDQVVLDDLASEVNGLPAFTGEYPRYVGKGTLVVDAGRTS
jgi:hypothetical protein